MHSDGSLGEFAKKIITAVPADLTTEVAKDFARNIPKFPEESIYIYSFIEGRLIYAHGWEDVLGYSDSEINLRLIMSSTSPEYSAFVRDLNDEALIFLQSEREELEKYSFIIEVLKLHKNGSSVPLIERIGVLKAINGQIAEVIGRFQINRNLRLSKIMHYQAYGPEKSEFEEKLRKGLFQHKSITLKEKEALALVSKGYTFKEIASELNVSQSAIEKRILPLYQKFEVKSLTHLITFAFENNILG